MSEQITKMNFAQIIKEYREREMISQQDLAKQLGVSFAMNY